MPRTRAPTNQQPNNYYRRRKGRQMKNKNRGRFKGPAVPKGGKRGGLKTRHLQPYVETKSLQRTDIENVQNGTALNTSAATNVKPRATTILIPKAWSDGLAPGVGNSQVVGNSVYDRYLTMKIVLTNFNNTSQAYNNIRCVQGWCKQPLQPTLDGVDPTSTQYVTKVGRAMVVDDFGSEFLTFSKKWKHFVVTKSFIVQRRNQNTQVYNPADGFSFNPINMKFDWTIKRKNLLLEDSDVGSANLIRAHSWIPFVAFYSLSLDGVGAEEDPPKIAAISKLWYSDS